MINDYAAKQKFKIFSGLYWRLWFLKKVDHVGKYIIWWKCYVYRLHSIILFFLRTTKKLILSTIKIIWMSSSTYSINELKTNTRIISLDCLYLILQNILLNTKLCNRLEIVCPSIKNFYMVRSAWKLLQLFFYIDHKFSLYYLGCVIFVDIYESKEIEIMFAFIVLNYN